MRENMKTKKGKYHEELSWIFVLNSQKLMNNKFICGICKEFLYFLPHLWNAYKRDKMNIYYFHDGWSSKRQEFWTLLIFQDGNLKI